MENKWWFNALKQALLETKSGFSTPLSGSSSDLDSRFDDIYEGLQFILSAFDTLEEQQLEMIGKIEKLVRDTNDYTEQQSVSTNDLKILDAIELEIADMKKKAQTFLVLHPESSTIVHEQKGGELPVGHGNQAELSTAKKRFREDELAKFFVCCFFAVLPRSPVKSRNLINWLSGLGVEKDTAVNTFQNVLTNGLVIPYYKRNRISIKGYVLNPLLRTVALSVAEDENLLTFDSEGRPTESLHTAYPGFFLTAYRKDQTVSVSFPTISPSFLFNLNAYYLRFKRNCFDGMQNLTVLQLGRWQSFSKDYRFNNKIVRATDPIKIIDIAAFFYCLGHLTNLRYLGLQGIFGIKELPNSVKKLSYLQSIDLQSCVDLESLTCFMEDKVGSSHPTNVLTSLQYLNLSECHLVKEMPAGVDDLSELDILKGFVMGYSQQQDLGRNLICRFRNMTKLRKLSIDIGSVVDIVEEQISSLKTLKYLTSITISCSSFYAKHVKISKGTEDILSLGWLPVSLKKLEVCCFPFEDVPSGVTSGKLKNLEKLYFRGGSLQKIEPIARDGAFLQLGSLRFRHLQHLMSPSLSFLKETFPSLNHLDISECPLDPQQFFDQSFIENIIGLVYFLIYPESSVAKRSHYIRHVIGCTRKNYQEAEEFADKGLAYLLNRGNIKATFKKGTSKVDGYILELIPSYIRPFAIQLAEKLGFLSFPSFGAPEEENQVVGLSLSDVLRSEPMSLFNISVGYLEHDELSKMKNLAYLQLGKWPGFVGLEGIRAVSPNSFFNALLPLRNLKYLGLQGVLGIIEIPDSISGLISLKVLDLRGCPDLVRIDRNSVASLKDLIHLDVSECNSLENMPPDFERLTPTLEVMLGLLMKNRNFTLGHFNNRMLRKISLVFFNETKFEKHELIFSCPNIRVVSIYWQFDSNATAPYDCHSVTLDWLPANIEKLELHGLPNSSIPSQFAPSLYPCLKKLYLIGGTICNLKSQNMDDQINWQQLDNLRLLGLKELETDWYDVEQLFPSLKSAEVISCPKITGCPVKNGMWIKSVT